jgi:hypothetical protein
MFGISKPRYPHPAGGGAVVLPSPWLFRTRINGVLIIMYYVSKDNKNIKEKKTFALKRNVDVLSHVTGAHLEAFWLVW